MILVQFGQWLIDKFRELTKSWQRDEEEAAKTEEERTAIQLKYQKREAQLRAAEQEIPDKIKTFVQSAFIEADKNADALIVDAEKKPLLKAPKKARQIEPPKA